MSNQEVYSKRLPPHQVDKKLFFDKREHVVSSTTKYLERTSKKSPESDHYNYVFMVEKPKVKEILTKPMLPKLEQKRG